MRGHVRQRGETWCFVVDVGRTHEGRRRQKWSYGYRTRKAAEEALAHLLVELQAGPYQEPSHQLLATYLQTAWLPAIPSTVRPSTLESYERNMRLHVVPELGTIELRRLRATDLNRLYSRLLTTGRVDGKGGLSGRSVHYIHTILHRALRDAVKWGLIATNPADRADPPRASTYRRHDQATWSLSELRKFITGVRHDRLAAMWILLSSTGMRRGEVVGLTWNAVDFETAQLQVVRTLVSVKDEVQWSAPKTARGRRSVALDAATLDALRAHRARQIEQRLAIGRDYMDLGLVFSREDGTAIHPKWVSDRFQRLATLVDVPVIRLHDLRHTYATLALQAGVPTQLILCCMMSPWLKV